MQIVYNLQSAEDIPADFIDVIKENFANKPIKISIEEITDETGLLMVNPVNKAILLASIEQDKNGQSILVNINEEDDNTAELKPSQLRGILSTETAEAMQKHIQKSRDEWDII